MQLASPTHRTLPRTLAKVLELDVATVQHYLARMQPTDLECTIRHYLNGWVSNSYSRMPVPGSYVEVRVQLRTDVPTYSVQRGTYDRKCSYAARERVVCRAIQKGQTTGRVLR